LAYCRAGDGVLDRVMYSVLLRHLPRHSWRRFRNAEPVLSSIREPTPPRAVVVSQFLFVLFFFQAEDGIRDWSVTGVQTCALPIYSGFAQVVGQRAGFRK